MGRARLLPIAVMGRYRTLLALPGAAGHVTAGFLGRLPMSMRTLGCLLMVSAVTGSYALAGVVSAVLGLSLAVGGPLLARLVDSHGQVRVIAGAMTAHTCGVIALVMVVVHRAPVWTYFPAAVLVGLSALPVGSLVRAGWADLVDNGERIQTAYALEAVVDEVIYIVGPVLVVALAVEVSPGAGLLGALVLAVSGALMLAAQHHPSRAETRQRTKVFRIPGLRVVTFVYFALGGLLGAIDVGMVMFAGDHGVPGAAGPLLALMTVASMVAGMRFGVVRWRAPLPSRLRVTAALLAAGALTLVFADSIPVMAGCVVLAGIGISPVLIVGSGLVESLVPRAGLTEGFAIVGSGVTLGMAAGSAAGGALADRAGSTAAFLLAVGCGLVSLAACLTGQRFLVPPSNRITTCCAPTTH